MRDERDVALEAKDAAIGVWRARYSDMERQHDYATGEAVRLAARLKVEEKARRWFQANIEAALALHERAFNETYCKTCLDPFPCPTAKALKGEKP